MDVFSRQNDAYGGSFTADGAAITFPEFDRSGAGGVGLLTQQLNIQYQQQMTKIYEIGSPRFYLIGGRSNGTVGLGRVIGPRPVQVAFYYRYGDLCKAGGNIIHLSIANECPTANTADGVTGSFGDTDTHFSVQHCVITSLGITVGAQDMMINEQVQMMFGSLNLQNSDNQLEIDTQIDTLNADAANQAGEQGGAFDSVDDSNGDGAFDEQDGSFEDDGSFDANSPFSPFGSPDLSAAAAAALDLANHPVVSGIASGLAGNIFSRF